MNKDLFRLNQILWLFLSLTVLLASYYFQWVKGLEPCPLCLMQRACVGLLTLLFLIGIGFQSSRFRKRLIIAEVLIGLAGLYFAGRQIWLQNLSGQDLPACLPGLDVLLRYFPWTDIVKAFLLGAADCSEITWQWLGLSMAAWSALYFIALLILLLCSLLVRQTNPCSFWGSRSK